MDLLLEIGTEEIPAKFMPDALAQLKNIAVTKLTDLNIPHGEIKTVGTPRRLTLIVREVASKQNDKQAESKGPSVKIAFDDNQNPTKAALGFARGQGVPAEDLIIKDGYVYAIRKEAGQNVEELLPDILPDIINSLTFSKTMRWGSLDVRFVRPIRSITALFGGKTVPFTLAGVNSGNTIRGHRFLGQKEIKIDSIDDYFVKLKENYVIADPGLRRQMIKEQAQKLADIEGGIADIDPELLEEITFLVEYPTALCGHFDEKYLALPPEAVITPMREHQRYFPVKDKSGKLMPAFITVRSGDAEHLDIVRRGNERVLKARLADARFFFEEDRKIPLENRVDALKTVVFQEGLGSVYDKTTRLTQLTEYIWKMLKSDGKEDFKEQDKEQDIQDLKRSAYLSKADLVTGMVGEFAELQGIMGREYALLDGENPAVAQAIFEHYLPRFAGDILPESFAGRALSIADKIDNITATFSRGLIPTGSQDPYALRRQALGIVHILIDAGYNLSLQNLFEESMNLFKINDAEKRQQLIISISDFFRLRLKNILSEEKIRYDIIEAVLAAGSDNIYDAYLRAKKLAEALEGPDAELFQKTAQAIIRASNLFKHAGQSEANPPEAAKLASIIDTDLFESETETALYQALNKAAAEFNQAKAVGNYKDALSHLASLTEPINAFFEAVMVMVPDESLKRNRLALLGAITALSAQIADFNKIVI